MAKKTTNKKATEKQVFQSENIKIEFRPYENKNTVGFCTVTFYDCITIYQCSVARTKDGKVFVAFPSYKASNGNYYNYAYLDKDDELAAELDTLINDSLELPFE